jgi:predicted peptidase
MKKRTFTIDSEHKEGLSYLLYIPEPDPATGVPPDRLLVWLHGGGESGDDLGRLERSGVPRFLEEGAVLPFVVLCPLHPYPNQFWKEHLVMHLVNQVVREYPIHPTRIHLFGVSREGYAACKQ